MKLKFKKIILCLVVLSTISPAVARNATNSSDANFWSPVMDAIIQVESGGNPKACNGNQCGAMQITPILVEQCNIILKERKSSKRYTLADRFNVNKSKEMFLLIQSYYNPDKNVEKAIRSWNGGQRYKVRSTQRYYNKVLAELNN